MDICSIINHFDDKLLGLANPWKKYVANGLKSLYGKWVTIVKSELTLLTPPQRSFKLNFASCWLLYRCIDTLKDKKNFKHEIFRRRQTFVRHTASSTIFSQVQSLSRHTADIPASFILSRRRGIKGSQGFFKFHLAFQYPEFKRTGRKLYLWYCWTASEFRMTQPQTPVLFWEYTN